MNTCGSCAHWVPEKREKVGSITMQSFPPYCSIIKDKRVKNNILIKYAEDKPESWCHKRASDEQLASRVKAGLITE